MADKTYEKKRKDLEEILFELSKPNALSKNENNKEIFHRKLEKIYWNGKDNENFRHMYSDIFAIITAIDSDEEIGSTEILSENMKIIRESYKPLKSNSGESIDISKSLDKLYDHVNLDCSRLSYSKKIENNSLTRLKEIEGVVKESTEKMDKLNKEVGKIDGMQKEYISILGIFSAVILAFTGGMTFSVSVLENINKASIYRISLITLIIGLVFYNLVFILLEFIRKINNFNSGKWKWSYIVFNVIIIIGIIFTITFYVCFNFIK